MIHELHSIKEQLFDAPNEIKSAFNEVVSYFDSMIDNSNQSDPKISETDYKAIQEFYWYVRNDLCKKLKSKSNSDWEGTYNIESWYIDRANKYKSTILKGSKRIPKYGYTITKGGRMSSNDAGYCYDRWSEIADSTKSFLKVVNNLHPDWKKEDWYI